MESEGAQDSILFKVYQQIVGNVVILTIVLFIIWSLLRLIFINHLFEWLVQYIKRNHFKPKGKTIPSRQREKLKEAIWFFLYYLITFFWGLFLLWDKEWFWDSAHFWIDLVHHPMPDNIKIYYLSQLAFYICALFFLHNNTREKHKDRLILFIHHVTTIGLVSLSYYFWYWRVGTVVFLLHDFSDIFLESCKIFHYIDQDFIGHFDFVIFTISFFICRIVLYPHRILGSVLFESFTIVREPNYKHWYLFVALLGMLQVMNLMWFVMIIQTIRRAIQQGGVKKDYRSDSEEELTINSPPDDDDSSSSDKENIMNRKNKNNLTKRKVAAVVKNKPKSPTPTNKKK